jgi:hypothetical protein
MDAGSVKRCWRRAVRIVKVSQEMNSSAAVGVVSLQLSCNLRTYLLAHNLFDIREQEGKA